MVFHAMHTMYVENNTAFARTNDRKWQVVRERNAKYFDNSTVCL